MADVGDWGSFAVMVGGASGALTGLLFVAVSLNRDQIVRNRALRSSAGQTLALLVIPLVLCALMLVPKQARWLLSVELIVFAMAAGLVLFRVQQRSERNDKSRIAELVDRRETSLLTSAMILVGAITYWSGHGGGLYWLVPSILLALISGILNAWFFLIADVE